MLEVILMTKYKVDSIVIGSVTGIEDYGVFVSLDDYYSGLIHISELSHGYVKDVNNFVKLGDTIRVKVVDVDDEACHLKLSIKDINYHVSKPKRMEIVEVGSGFGILEEKLPNWIENKKQEYEMNKC